MGNREIYDIYEEAKSKISLNGNSIVDYRSTVSDAWTKDREGVTLFLSDGSIVSYYPTKTIEFDELLKMDFDEAFRIVTNRAWRTKFMHPNIACNGEPVTVMNAEVLDKDGSTSFIANFIVNGSEIQICRKRETEEDQNVERKAES